LDCIRPSTHSSSKSYKRSMSYLLKTSFKPVSNLKKNSQRSILEKLRYLITGPFEFWPTELDSYENWTAFSPFEYLSRNRMVSHHFGLPLNFRTSNWTAKSCLDKWSYHSNTGTQVVRKAKVSGIQISGFQILLYLKRLKLLKV
jgi:hypothetical protein